MPLREGGSLPALAEADDDFKYVLKFRGTGHGVKALIAELLGGQIAHALGLPVPELVFANLDEAFGRTEGDEEIQELLSKSQGLNLALHFLSGAITFDPAVTTVDAKLASQIVWLDAFITNIDRTVKNTNMLLWNRKLWLIDHGASFYFHHTWTTWETHAKSNFALVKDHVLLSAASMMNEVNEEFKKILTPEILKSIVDLIPIEWLQWEDTDENAQQIKDTYLRFLTLRLQHADQFTNEAIHARKTLI